MNKSNLLLAASASILQSCLLGCILIVATVTVGEARASNAQPVVQEDEVVARIDQEPIYLEEAEYEVKLALRGRQASGPALFELRGVAVQQLISQRLILRYLVEEELAATNQDVQLELERIGRQLSRTDRTLADYLSEQGISERLLRNRIQWRLSWERFLATSLTDQNLATFFDQHRIEYDGTKRHIHQIFIRPENLEREQDWDEAETFAQELLGTIQSDPERFAELARAHSDSPSGQEGGDLGLYLRNGELPEAILAEVFQSEQGETSEPIRTPYGYHLVKWSDQEDGELEWDQVGDRLAFGATEYLFKWIAEQQEEGVDIQRSQTYPNDRPLPSDDDESDN